MVEPLTGKYADQMYGVLNCYDRIILSGNLHPLCYAKGMTGYLYRHGLRIFDYAQFAQPLRDELRAHAARLAQENGIEIEFIGRTDALRKEERVQQIVQSRGTQPGLVHIFSAMEQCASYRPWHDKPSQKTYLKSTSGKCLHYYFYFLDEELGLCYLRVPTWCPFRLQFYCNGHNWLANQLSAQGVEFVLQDNAFLQIADFEVANQVAAAWDIEQLHAQLDAFAQQYCPVATSLALTYTWSIQQAEYATDLVFKQQSTLQAFYPLLLETLIQAVKPADIATFLGRKLHGNYQGEMGNRFNVRHLGRRLKHQMGPVSLKLYDKFNIVLRIETTVNNVSFFSHYRTVQHRDGSTSRKTAPLKKTIYSLPALQQALIAANHRYLAFLSPMQTAEVGVAKLQQVTEPKVVKQRRFKGFTLFSQEDTSLFRSLLDGAFALAGFSNHDLRQRLPHVSSGQVTRLLKRLRVHGLIKKVGKRYRYYLTPFGRQVAAMTLKLREMVMIPALAHDAISAS